MLSIALIITGAIFCALVFARIVIYYLRKSENDQ